MLIVFTVIGFLLGVFIGWVIFDRCDASQTDRQKVLDYIHKNGSITSEQAQSIGVNHVRSVICKLKRKGTSIHNANPLGQKARYEFK